MKEFSVAVIISLIAVLVLIFSDFGKNSVLVYDCGMAEWHPDIPPKVKEECRKQYREKNQKQKNETTITA